MATSFDPTVLSSCEKDALISTLLAQVDALMARVAVLETENAALREKLKAPPKTPDNSGTPPSLGRKANGDGKASPKARVHAGAHRPLHPNPSRCAEVRSEHCPRCRADVTGVAQVAVQAYDRIEIPEIKPDVTRVILHGGVCPCCAGRFKATAPAGLEPGSPFGPNLRAFALYLRFGQAIPFKRLARLMRDLFGVEISEGALANLLQIPFVGFQPGRGGRLEATSTARAHAAMQDHPRHIRLDLGDLDAVVGLHRHLGHARHVGAAAGAVLRAHLRASGRVRVKRAVRPGMDPGFRARLAVPVRLVTLRRRRAGVAGRLRRRLQLLPQRRVLGLQGDNPRQQRRVLALERFYPRRQRLDLRQQRGDQRVPLGGRPRDEVRGLGHRQVDSRHAPQRNRNLPTAASSRPSPASPDYGQGR